MRRLFEYIAHHADLELVGCLDAQDKESCVLVVSQDADLAGDLEATKSTSGLWIEMQSADGKRCWPIAWRSKRQGSTASSICEAETISVATALKSEALPLLGLFSEALGRTVTFEYREDNTQCISAVRSGFSAALRHLPRTERIAVGVVSETFAADDCQIVYQESALHKGDVFYEAAGARSVRSSDRTVDWVSGGRRSPATKAILAHGQLRSPLASRQLGSPNRIPQLHLRVGQILRHQEVLNVELVGRPPASLSHFARRRAPGGFALTLAACPVLMFISSELGGRYSSPLLDLSCSSCCARDVPWDGRCLGGTCFLRVSPFARQLRN